MVIHNNKIEEATMPELFSIYLEREYDEIMSFPDYVAQCEFYGTKVVGECEEE